jgi:hypothetical protein
MMGRGRASGRRFHLEGTDDDDLEPWILAGWC